MAVGHLSTERTIWLFGILFTVLLAGNFFRLKLARNYRFFLAYLIFDCARSVALWFYSPGSTSYRNLWRAAEPVIWILYILVVLELCSLVLRDYTGIHALGRWIIYGSLALSVLLSTITVLPTWMRSREGVFALQRFLMVERGIDFAVVLLLLLLLVFLVLFPIQLSRNVIVHSILYAVFFTTNSMGILIVNLTGYRLSITVSTCLMGVSILCMIGWMVLITRDGEQKLMAIRHPVSVDEDRLIAQLTEINATLMRTSKRVNPQAFGAQR
ncbi:MAG TPA: hypothetical protein VMT32_18790 [Bryobacteraceae bacterium]|nr:hypothetical protein [Bryobacteraceae bacterium]